MDNNMETLFEKLNQATEGANMLATQFHLQFETMAELQKDEREAIRKHYDSIIQKYTRIIMGLIIALVVLIGIIVGGAIYLFANFDIGYHQTADVGGDGQATIHDGIHFNDTSNAD